MIELLSQKLLYPFLFKDIKAHTILGAYALSLNHRGLLVVISTGICPIVSLLLLISIPPPADWQNLWFALTVGIIGIIFGLISALMLGHTVLEPVMALKFASQEVELGNFTTRILLKRADEFGTLIDEFNEMVLALQEKEYLQAMFGRHVGQKAAQQILLQNPDLGGYEQKLTVMFIDLRDFTARSSVCLPQESVALLNRFFTVMVKIVEQQNGGMVNKFLGDGFMALFGVGEPDVNHAWQAVRAGQEMLESLTIINQQITQEGQLSLAMGIGIHTGVAVVGSIGSPERLEYTAIGDTVNIASRVESLTKTLQVPLLLTHSTRQSLPNHLLSQELPAQMVKGQSQPIRVYMLAKANSDQANQEIY